MVTKVRLALGLIGFAVGALSAPESVQAQDIDQQPVPTNCAGREPLPSALAMKSDLPQRIPFPEVANDATGVYGKLANGQRLSFHLKPEVRAGINAQSGALLRNGALPPALREMIIVRVGYRTSSRYEVEQHTSLGERLGIPRAKLLGLACVEPSGLSEDERSVIAFVDALLTDYRPSDTVLQGVRSRFGDGQVLELIFVAGNWWNLSRMLETAGIPIDGTKIGEQGGVVRENGR